MLLIPAMLLFIEGTEALTELSSTYQHWDAVTGRMLTCDRCPAGFHLRAHCSARKQTECAPCSPRHFTQHWNLLTKCLYCRNTCGENQIVKVECSPFHNQVCECKEGYYWHLEFCRKHAECPTGYGVKSKGSAHNNNKCEKCPRGYYSSVISPTAACVKHTDCAARGHRVVLNGTVWHDNICASFEETLDDGIELIRKILPDFFTHQKINPKKLFRFAKKFLHFGDKKLLADSERLSTEDLQGYITKWIMYAPRDMLRMMPKMLRKSKLNKTAAKLKRKIKKSTAAHARNNLVGIS